MSTSTRVVAVVLNWNKPRETAACVEALGASRYQNLDVVVVDNGSRQVPDGLPRRVELIRNAANLGFCGGVNVGIRHAMAGQGAGYIWLVNNDAQVEPGTLPAMLAVMQREARVGLASPVIRNGDAGDDIEFCGGLWEGTTFRTTADPGTYAGWAAAGPERIWLVGTALLIRGELIGRIGLFDERFFAYWEDNDFSLRSIAAGYRNVVVKDAVVRHWSGTPLTDPGSKPPHYYYYMARNELLLLRKHVRAGRRIRPMWWALHRQLDWLRRLSDPALSDAVLMGLWDGFRGRGGAFDPGRRLTGPTRRLVLSTVGTNRHFH